MYLQANQTAITAIKEALAQPEQEPVAWMHTMDNTEGHKANKPYVLFTKSKRNPFGVAGRDYSKSYPVTKQPLYTTPPQRKPLTDEEIQEAVTKACRERKLSWLGFHEDEQGHYTIPALSPSNFQFARAIEAAHGIKGEA